MENTELPLSAKIESILFYKAEPVSVRKLCEFLSVGEEEVRTALIELEAALRGRGIQLVFAGDDVVLGTSAAVSPLIEAMQRDEISRDLGKAGLETLAIVLYKGPLSRREIDYIRGVNSTFILRNLLIRGLIERTEGEGKERGYIYRPTPELLSFMGISRIEDLPEYEIVRGEMENISDSEDKESEGEVEK
jgi:segregation and condensation protein B